MATHDTPTLGNYSDPVEEIFYILLSAKTADAQYRRTHAALTARFPTLRDLAAARPGRIASCIAAGGMANVKADRIKGTARKLLDDLGEAPADTLRAMGDREAYSFLTTLPGMGPKSALCVMMCSLNCDVFPVDVNVSRIAVRLGAVPAGLKHYHYQELLPPKIPDGRSKELHVGMVVHGRRICLPRTPKCDSCAILDLCKFGAKRLGIGRRGAKSLPPRAVEAD